MIVFGTAVTDAQPFEPLRRARYPPRRGARLGECLHHQTAGSLFPQTETCS